MTSTSRLAKAPGRSATSTPFGGRRNGPLPRALRSAAASAVQLSHRSPGCPGRIRGRGHPPAGRRSSPTRRSWRCRPARRAITFDPPLPDEKAGALRGVRYGQAAKLSSAFGARRRQARRCRSPSASGARRRSARTATRRLRRRVRRHAGRARTARGAAGPEQWLDGAARAPPRPRARPRGALISTWEDDPWARARTRRRRRAADRDRGAGASGWTPGVRRRAHRR